MSHRKREEEESQELTTTTSRHRTIFGGSVRNNYPGESLISSTPKTSNFHTFLNQPQPHQETHPQQQQQQLPLQLGLSSKLKLKRNPKSSMLTNLFRSPQKRQQQQQDDDEEEEEPSLPTLEQMIHPPPFQQEQQQQQQEFHDNHENGTHDDPSHVFLQVSRDDPLRLSPPPDKQLESQLSDLTCSSPAVSPTKPARKAMEQPPMTPPIRHVIPRIYNSNSAPPPLSPMTPHDTTTTTTTTTTPYYKASSTRTKHPQALLSVPVLDHSALFTTPTPTASNGTSLHKPALSSSSSSEVQENTTSHAQSFVLAVAFMAIWSPQNCMAPNLTQMADYFHFDPNQRDLFLGANIAFATGVLSLPVSALIGFVADVVPSRKQLFAATVLLGGIASICTGYSNTYSQLYFARFANGGCMSGSVPVAFSLLGDLFDTKDRNAASSGLTAMMGAGIIFGQVYSGVVGDKLGWQHPFRLSGVLTILTSFFVMCCVQEPVRGGKEKVLQEMLARGTRYDRKLTLQGFFTAMTKNESNFILMGQGFFANIPWGVIFVFLNDFLSQEKGMSVPDATLLVFFFGVGCALGGVLGGYWGQLTTQINRSYMPLFMAATTFLGIFPFLGLLDGAFDRANTATIALSLSGGLIANLPSVNVRPCLINVNPPETRGAALTAANLIINFARGCGPSFITMMGGIWQVDRQYSFNVTLLVFWTIASLQLLFLARSLPKDQDAMEAELALYAETVLIEHRNANQGGDRSVASGDNINDNDDLDTLADESIVSIDERATSFDANAARESLTFMSDALREIGDEWLHHHHHHHNDDPDDDDEEDVGICSAFGDRPNKKARQKKNQHAKQPIFLEQQGHNPFLSPLYRNNEMTWRLDPLQHSVAQQILEGENENNSHGAISATNSESDALLQTNATDNNNDPRRDYNSMSLAPMNGLMYTI